MAAKADRFRKDGGGSRTGNAMQGFTPPVVLGNLQPGNGARLVHQLRGFFFQRHPGNQVIHSDTNGLRGIEIGRKLRAWDWLAPGFDIRRQVQLHWRSTRNRVNGVTHSIRSVTHREKCSYASK